MPRIEDAPDWLKAIMNRHEAAFYDDKPDGLPIVDVPKSDKPSDYISRKVTRDMRAAAEEFVKTSVPPLRGALDFPEA